MSPRGRDNTESNDDVPKITFLRAHDFEVEFSPFSTSDSCADFTRCLLRHRIALGTHRPCNVVLGRLIGNMYELPRHDRCLRLPSALAARSGCLMFRLSCAAYIACPGICVQSNRRFETCLRLYIQARCTNDETFLFCCSCCAGKLYAMSRRANVRSVGSQLRRKRLEMLALSSRRSPRFGGSFSFLFAERFASSFAAGYTVSGSPATVR